MFSSPTNNSNVPEYIKSVKYFFKLFIKDNPIAENGKKRMQRSIEFSSACATNPSLGN